MKILIFSIKNWSAASWVKGNQDVGRVEKPCFPESDMSLETCVDRLDGRALPSAVSQQMCQAPECGASAAKVGRLVARNTQSF